MAHILLIDDDRLVLQALQIVLEENGHSVATAPNGKVGMRMVRETKFDLVITDLIMPEKEGMETLQDIKRRDASQKVIVISGGGRQTPEQYLEPALMLGADDALSKPISSRELLHSVEKVLAQ